MVGIGLDSIMCGGFFALSGLGLFKRESKMRNPFRDRPEDVLILNTKKKALRGKSKKQGG